MMTDQEVTQEQYEQLLDDAGYLQDEAEAMKYVIDSIPSTEKTPDGDSIFGMLRLIDHAQKNYYRPIIEKMFAENRIISLSDYQQPEETFEEVKDDEDKDIQRVLNKIIKHRAALLNVFNKISLIDWERGVKDLNGHVISMMTFARQMIRNERKILKDIADLVLIYQQQKEQQREVQSRAKQRNSS